MIGVEESNMLSRRVGPYSVFPIGLGCMNLSHAYGVPPSAEQGERVLRAALDAGVTLFDTAALYGFGRNETLVGRVLKEHRSKITLCSKGGLFLQPQADGSVKRVIDGRPATLRANVEAMRALAYSVAAAHDAAARVPFKESALRLTVCAVVSVAFRPPMCPIRSTNRTFAPSTDSVMSAAAR